MKRIKLEVAYDGTNYCGWQIQPKDITIEKVLNDNLTIGNHLVVDLEPLVDLHQMGGCKEGCPLSRLGQHRGEEGTDGTFSVGPRHMDDLHRTLRMAQTV